MTEESSFDPAEIERAKNAEIIEGLVQRRDTENLQAVMALKPGRAFVWRLLGDCGLYETSFTPDPYVVAWKEGKRQVGLALYAEVLTACPKEAILMQHEAHERAQLRERGVV